jgi:N-acetylmuramic acid 6-phosphate (MurNAc-6-P) etherase
LAEATVEVVAQELVAAGSEQLEVAPVLQKFVVVVQQLQVVEVAERELVVAVAVVGRTEPSVDAAFVDAQQLGLYFEQG